ncbi:MAG: PAS domain S-box protein, partial [Hylemonella sp.]
MPEQLTPQASPEISPHASQVYFEYGLNGILETDSQGRVLRANPAAASITGQDIKRLKGILLSDLLTEDSKPAARRYFSLLKEQGINQTEFRMMLRNGKQIT